MLGEQVQVFVGLQGAVEMPLGAVAQERIDRVVVNGVAEVETRVKVDPFEWLQVEVRLDEGALEFPAGPAFLRQVDVAADLALENEIHICFQQQFLVVQVGDPVMDVCNPQRRRDAEKPGDFFGIGHELLLQVEFESRNAAALIVGACPSGNRDRCVRPWRPRMYWFWKTYIGRSAIRH